MTMGYVIVIGILVFIIWIQISRVVNDTKRDISDSVRAIGPTQSEINRINSDKKLKQLIYECEHTGNLHMIWEQRLKLWPFASRAIELGADILLIGVEEYRNNRSQTSIIIMKNGFVGSNCCKVVSFDKKLGELEPYRLSTKRYVPTVTYKKNQRVVGSAIAGGIIGGDIGAIVGAAHAQSVNSSGGKIAHSYVPTEVYNLMVVGNHNPLTCLTHIVIKQSILGDRFKGLRTFRIIDGEGIKNIDKFSVLQVGKCTQEQATELANFFNNR